MANGEQVTVEQVFFLLVEREGWRGRGKRVTASTLVEAFKLSGIEEARDLMGRVAGREGIVLNLKRGIYWDGATLTIGKADAS